MELSELQTGIGQRCDMLRALGMPVEREVDELEMRLNWRRRRKSSARCLTCGSEAIWPFPGEGKVVHPGNGRRVEVRCQDRCDAAIVGAIYSTEGTRLDALCATSDPPGIDRLLGQASGQVGLHLPGVKDLSVRKIVSVPSAAVRTFFTSPTPGAYH
ncbi:hypothetical protein PX52LOC_02403 [Limnoglobus roseus]|uniref:Uncharacterized protein n=1 Tax=Limnoglobus roseus TaxID=2598579 RepID=A0A5C1A9S2_9BACT|nr:hypothetical protein PX52LOC_02403 [Limnoglobus roseus]